MTRWIVVCGFLLASACNDELPILLGVGCTEDSVCEERCFVDADKYPGGFCSVTCASDDDCPLGSHCVDENGPLCLFECGDGCESVGPGWVCATRSRFGGGNVDVCFGE